MRTTHPITTARIHDHSAFLRSLAAALVHDAAGCDDAVQDTWVAALSSSPPRSWRAWLGTIVRRQAARSSRSHSRRRARELAAARPEAVPSAASVAERAELLRIVADVVAGLREPYREAVLLRYYEDLPPRAIAERLDVPVATVHSRIQRGLRQIKDGLVQRRGGDPRHAVESLGLALGLDPRSSAGAGWTAVLAGGVVKARVALAVVLALAAVSVITVSIVSDGGEPLAEDDRLPALASVPHEHTTPASSVAEAAASEARRAAPLEPIVGEPSLRNRTGVVLDPVGRPVAGARVFVGAASSALREVVATDLEGRFEAALAADDRLIGARAPGWAPSALLPVAPEHDAGADRAAGNELTLVLPTYGAELDVVVRDRLDAPVRGARVFVGREQERDVRLANGTMARSSRGCAEESDAAGTARFRGLPPGWTRVTVQAPDYAPAAAFATLRLDGPNLVDVRLERGLYVEGQVRDEAGAPVSDARLTRGSSDAVEAFSDLEGRYRLGPIDAGKVVVIAPDGRRAERRLSGQPGALLTWNPVLLEDATVRGIVLDASGRPAAGVWVSVHLDTWPGWRRGVAAGVDGRFAVHGCPAADLRVEVSASASAELPLVVREGVTAGPGELRLSLPGGETVAVRGRLQRIDQGEPADVQLYVQHATTAQRQRLSTGPGRRVAVSEQDGSFLIEDVPPGRYQLVALGPPVEWARLAAFEVGGADTDIGVLELARPGLLRTRLLRAAGPPSATASFLLERREELVTITSLDGEFPAELSLAPGRYVLQVEVTPGPQTEYEIEIRPGQTSELEVDLSSSCRHRVLIRYASGRPPTGSVSLLVRREDVPRTIEEAGVVRVEGPAWVRELELEPGRYSFQAISPEGVVIEQVHNLFTSSPGREVELVIPD